MGPFEGIDNFIGDFSAWKGSVFYLTLGLAAVAFAMGEVLWRWAQHQGRIAEPPSLPDEDRALGALWTVVPVVFLLIIAVVPLRRASSRAASVSTSMKSAPGHSFFKDHRARSPRRDGYLHSASARLPAR